MTASFQFILSNRMSAIQTVCRHVQVVLPEQVRSRHLTTLQPHPLLPPPPRVDWTQQVDTRTL